MNTIKSTNFRGEEIDLDKNLFKEKTSSMLIAGAIGDALGVPVEMKNKQYIENQYGRVDDYLDSGLNIFFNKGGLAEGKTGLVSDDTILSFSGVKSIINKQKIDFDNILETSLEDYKNFPYGFGYGTTSSLARYELLKKLNKLTNNYINLGEYDSAGNGVIMKQSPYAAYFLARNTEEEIINTNIEVLTRLTHNHPTAVVASQVHNKLLMELLKSETKINLEELLEYLIEYSKKQENNLKLEIEKQKADKISDLLQNLLEDKKNGGLQSFDEILDKYGWGENSVYSSGYVVTTMGIVYSIFLNKQNFDGLLDSINIGGDVDTFAAIIGNMIGAYKGEFYDKYYEKGIEKIDDLKNESERFVDIILTENNNKDINNSDYQKKLEDSNLEKENLKKEFLKEIEKLNNSGENIFYNSKGNPNAFKANVPHLGYAETLKYGKIQNGYFMVTKPFYIADFHGSTIKKTEVGEKIKFIKLNEIK